MWVSLHQRVLRSMLTSIRFILHIALLHTRVRCAISSHNQNWSIFVSVCPTVSACDVREALAYGTGRSDGNNTTATTSVPSSRTPKTAITITQHHTTTTTTTTRPHVVRWETQTRRERMRGDMAVPFSRCVIHIYIIFGLFTIFTSGPSSRVWRAFLCVYVWAKQQ